ncbi:hypothetical protein L1077_24075 [Pseudoalteromonas luteoviolacea]|uniref:hypothetical protein n=1 Tax=Pseudoalteromonas luteoviolacea TaxID=43657 RepID=UPI001F2CC660|nr:hypothetical protein [Pseudoalteromonas luteoviolacea]MCF6442510.1 hypothetical protein [Pseudoalteromonas luteoviolacea]
MILHASHYNTTNTTTQYQQTQKVNNQEQGKVIVGSPQPEHSKNTGDKKLAWEAFTEKVESDPSFASDMAEAVSFIPDKMLVSLAEAPPLTDVKAFTKWASKSDEFDKEAAVVTEQRIKIYNKMKDEGETDADIFKRIMDFNRDLPLDYQVKAGMLAIDTHA